MNVEPELVGLVDEIVKNEGIYSSRNDFIRDAIRTRVLELKRLQLRKKAKEIGKACLKKGWNGQLASKKQREKAALEFLKGKKLSID